MAARSRSTAAPRPALRAEDAVDGSQRLVGRPKMRASEAPARSGAPDHDAHDGPGSGLDAGRSGQRSIAQYRERAKANCRIAEARQICAPRIPGPASVDKRRSGKVSV